jgi:DNA-binding response OmpR family regulator
VNEGLLRMLLVEDDDDDCALLRALLRHAEVAAVELVHVDNRSDGLSLLNDQTFDIILLDLSLPDSTGNGTIQKLHEHAPDTAIVVLTGPEDETMAMTAIRDKLL